VGESSQQNPFKPASESNAANLLTPRTKRDSIPYYESIKALNKMESFTTPREKLYNITQMFANLKTAVVDFWKGKVLLFHIFCFFFECFWSILDFFRLSC
jgi:hypothetical protein